MSCHHPSELVYVLIDQPAQILNPGTKKLVRWCRGCGALYLCSSSSTFPWPGINGWQHPDNSPLHTPIEGET